MDNWSQLHDQSLPFGVQGCDLCFVGIGNCPSVLIWFVNSCVICCGFGLDLFQ